MLTWQLARPRRGRQWTALLSTLGPPEPHHLREQRAAEERSRKHETAEDESQERALIPQNLSWKAVSRALIGNGVITTLKFGVFLQTGSSAMLSEAVHTLADSGNQMLLLKGLQQASQTPDRRYQYGYGKASFYWGLVSALGMFWSGAGVACAHGVYTLMHPPQVFELSNEMVAVLGFSFLVDGFVLTKTVKDVAKTRPSGVSLWKHLRSVRDPFVLAVLFEDTAACAGVAIAGIGIILTKIYDDVFYDTFAGITVGLLLASVAGKLISINRNFLLGHAVDEDIINDIRNILHSRPTIDTVNDVQSQWIGPYAFAFKAECDFNGYHLAKKLEDPYVPLFIEAVNNQTSKDPTNVDLRTVMAWMAEDVTRLIEQEIKQVENLIRKKHPMAAFIELEPDSKVSFLRASDGKAWTEEDPTKHIHHKADAARKVAELLRDTIEKQENANVHPPKRQR